MACSTSQSGRRSELPAVLVLGCLRTISLVSAISAWFYSSLFYRPPPAHGLEESMLRYTSSSDGPMHHRTFAASTRMAQPIGLLSAPWPMRIVRALVVDVVPGEIDFAQVQGAYFDFAGQWTRTHSFKGVSDVATDSVLQDFRNFVLDRQREVGDFHGVRCSPAGGC